MIDEVSAREFGKLEAQVESLQDEVSDVRKDVKCLLELANKSKGGFWMGMTIASFVGAAVTFFMDRLFK